MGEYIVWAQKWPVAIVIAGICILGIVCKGIASAFCFSLIRQVKRLTKGKRIRKHSMSSRLVAGYEQAMESGDGILDVDSYIEEAVLCAKVGNVSTYHLENMNLVAMVATITLGAVGAMAAYMQSAPAAEICFVFATGLAFTGIGGMMEVCFRNDYYRTMYQISMENYLQHNLQAEMKKKREKETQVRQQRVERTSEMFGGKMRNLRVTQEEEPEEKALLAAAKEQMAMPDKEYDRASAYSKKVHTSNQRNFTEVDGSQQELLEEMLRELLMK